MKSKLYKKKEAQFRSFDLKTALLLTIGEKVRRTSQREVRIVKDGALSKLWKSSISREKTTLPGKPIVLRIPITSAESDYKYDPVIPYKQDNVQ